MKRINQLAAFALALVVVGGTLSETEAQRRGRQSAQNLVADENVDGVNDSHLPFVADPIVCAKNTHSFC